MHPFLVLFARLSLGGVWVVAGLAKVTQKRPFSASIADFGVTSRPAVALLGRLLPLIEVTLGILLLVGRWTVVAALTSGVLLILFSGVVVLNLVRGRKVECNCFGEWSRAPTSWWTVGRNAGLFGLVLGVLLGNPHYLSLDALLSDRGAHPLAPPATDLIPVGMIVMTILLLWMLASATWQAASALAHTYDGPALDLPERRFVRRWISGPHHRDVRTSIETEGS